MNNYDRIPIELQQLNQWLVWKDNKVPYNAHTNNLASVTNSDDWCSFVDAVAVANQYSGIGFVFSSSDPYSFLDLDNTKGDEVALQRQREIYHEMDSYSEISPSGNGLHIIVRGNVIAGRRRSFIEIYSTGRYATFTGNVFNDKPIADRQEQLTRLWEQMGSGPVAQTMYHDEAQKISDNEIVKIATNASNGEKFGKLYKGEWQDVYPDIAAAGHGPSEADFALIDMLAFYTKNQEQIARIFYSSGLGKRGKVQRKDYVQRMILRSFDRMLPPIDFDGFRNQLELKLATVHTNPIDKVIQAQAPINNQAIPQSTISLPPGLLGELAQFIYAAAPRPVPEIALAGAIGLMAGICGRAYNISGTGLNQYILLLADTGTGKEAMASGIDKIMNEVRKSCPTSTTYIGPSEIASGQALIKHVSKTSQCFVSILGEFGLRLQSMSSQRASSAEIGLRRILLDLYNKSGFGQMWRGTIYADREKNVDATRSPAFTILGESTPERFYGALNEEMISEGLLPRFMIIEYLGARPPLNKNSDVHVPFNLNDHFGSLVAQCETIIHRNSVCNVVCDPIAQKMLDEFDEYATDLINKSDKDIIRQLWNRAHIKALKLSALVAVGVNNMVPTIIPEYVTWAINIVRNDIKALSTKFEAGLIGLSASEAKQQSDLIKVIKEFVVKDWSYNKKYCQGKADQKLHDNKIVPYAYMSKRLINMASFKNDSRKATPALKSSIQILIDSDRLREVNNEDKIKKYNTTQKCYIVSDDNIID